MGMLIGRPAGVRPTQEPRTCRAILTAIAAVLLAAVTTGAFAAAKPPAPEGAQNFIVKAASRPPGPEGAQNFIVKAASRPPAAKLNDAQIAEVARVETYLNTIRTLRAKFLQVAENGATAEGTLLLSRPGLMRIDYDPPSPHLIVADGIFLIYHEKKLNQTSHIPLSSSLAGFLVRDAIKLTGDVTLTRFEQERGVIRLSLVKTDDAEAGQLTLVFSDGPLQLRQWTVTDGQGGTTRITLVNSEFGVPLDKKVFAFDPPKRERLDR